MLMMCSRFAWILALMFAAPAAFAVSGNVVATENVHARLESEVRSIAPGQSFWVALLFDIRDGWHTYWRNPGDSGQATRLSWTLPRGFTAGPIVWTAPHRFELAPLINFGYAKRALHLVQIAAPKDLAGHSPVTLRAHAHWLVCSNMCIPESADLQLTLPVTATRGALDPSAAALFAAARSELPQPAPATATAQVRNGRLLITLGADWGATLTAIRSLTFVPYDDGVIEYAAPQVMTRSGGGVVLAMKLGYQPPKAGPVRGILLAEEQSGAGTVTVPLKVAARLQRASATARTAPVAAARGPSFGALLLLAILGGLVLNLMPCVFPVLSIKAIGLVAQAKEQPRAVRAKGLVFAAGVVASMLTLATVLLALRAGGQQIGWGFQLQSPLFVTLMAYLLFVVGLNLSGVFEFGGGLAGAGDVLTRGDGYRASFFTGVLTTLVATPCTAPFMAAAVGAALTQTSGVALAIFAALGVGLALPYLLLSFAPWLRSALPKPGAWMDTLKQLFAFPMYASAAWLIWVLAQQASALGQGAALAGLVLIGLAAWAYQKSESHSGIGRVAALAAAGLALLAAVLLPVKLTRAPAAGAAPSRPQANAGQWEPYDPRRVSELRAAGRPLLINFTASWCLTCLVNEHNVFADSSVTKLLSDKGVTLMKGDWTNRDPRITQALAHFGRAGVPLYVVYDARPGSRTALVLPQLLTAGVVEKAFAALPNRSLK
ncbi:MAG TPA: thioredoxin family protein [Steroidobacteraceae bacterium]|nr:thioredoxin family protein [Steroidobacteraceae bacterium]